MGRNQAAAADTLLFLASLKVQDIDLFLVHALLCLPGIVGRARRRSISPEAKRYPIGLCTNGFSFRSTNAAFVFKSNCIRMMSSLRTTVAGCGAAERGSRDNFSICAGRIDMPEVADQCFAACVGVVQ